MQSLYFYKSAMFLHLPMNENPNFSPVYFPRIETENVSKVIQSLRYRAWIFLLERNSPIKVEHFKNNLNSNFYANPKSFHI